MFLDFDCCRGWIDFWCFFNKVSRFFIRVFLFCCGLEFVVVLKCMLDFSDSKFYVELLDIGSFILKIY